MYPVGSCLKCADARQRWEPTYAAAAEIAVRRFGKAKMRFSGVAKFVIN